jgi:hypothetical protein
VGSLLAMMMKQAMETRVNEPPPPIDPAAFEAQLKAKLDSLKSESAAAILKRGMDYRLPSPQSGSVGYLYGGQ